MLASHHDKADLEFLSALLNGSLDVPDLLTAIPFRIPNHFSRNQSLLLLDLIFTNIFSINVHYSTDPPNNCDPYHLSHRIFYSTIKLTTPSPVTPNTVFHFKFQANL